MSEEEIEIFYPTNKKQWRAWLQKNHIKKRAVWVVFYKVKSGKPTINWSDAVDEALCFGWIDSKKIPVDEEKSMQFFSKRKPKSVWSKINKAKIQRLIDEELMAEAGHQCVAIAKQNGSWNTLDEVEELVVPKDLEREFKKHRGSKAYFSGLSRSVKKAMLQWIVLAKQTETRQRRITEIASLAAQGLKPKQFG